MDPLHLLIVGSYASADQPGLHLVAVDPAAGRMIELGDEAGVDNPSYALVSPDRTSLYVVSEIGDGAGALGAGRVHSFRLGLDGPEAHLSAVTDVASGGDHPCHLSIDPSGRWSIVANYGSGTLSVLPIGPDGHLAEAVETVQHTGSGPVTGRQDAPHVHGSAVTPDGRYLAVADLGADRVVVYAFDSSTGSLDHRSEARVAPGAGPRHLVFDRTGRLLVVANELDNTVTTYGFDPATGRTTPIATHSTLPGATDGARTSGDGTPGDRTTDQGRSTGDLVAAIRLAPTGDRVYVSNRGHDTIAVFGLDADGGLTGPQLFPSGGHWPRDLALLPDGRHMVVAAERSDHIALLPVSADGSSIGPPIATLAIPSPTCILPIGRPW